MAAADGLRRAEGYIGAYVVLRSYAAPDGICFPSYGTLQADIGCGINLARPEAMGR